MGKENKVEKDKETGGNAEVEKLIHACAVKLLFK